MLHIFTEANPSRVWTDWNTEFGSHKQNCQNLVYTTNSTGIDLADPDRVGLKELFKNDAILYMFTGSNPNWRYCSRNRGMSKNIVWAGGFFNPERVKCRQ